MDDRTKREQEVARGAQAEALLRNPLLQEAFEALETEYKNSWVATSAYATEDREKLFFMVNALYKVREDLESWVNTGKIASRQIEVMDDREPFH